ncbi:unnamed protein product [Closterium sp. Naga37s-1]|nr:unnamed protein product [Closterium sp. Naga37s-1]
MPYCSALPLLFLHIPYFSALSLLIRHMPFSQEFLLQVGSAAVGGAICWQQHWSTRVHKNSTCFEDFSSGGIGLVRRGECLPGGANWNGQLVKSPSLIRKALPHILSLPLAALPLRIPPSATHIPLQPTSLCDLPPHARIGSLLGKHGVIIQSIRESTGARLKLADPIPGTDERVIIISARSDKNFRSGDSATDGDGAVDRPDDWSVAQEALIRVHARIADADGDNREFRDKDGAEGGANSGAGNSGGTPARLLVPSSQIGCLLGKGGSIIAGMRQDSGAHIRIFNKDKLPPCALPTDELVQVTGEYPVVQKALELISVRLRRSPPRDPPNFLAMHPTSGYHQPAGYQPAPGYQASGYHRGADAYPPRSAPAAAFPPQGYSPYAPPQSYAAAPSLFGGVWGAGAAAGGAHGYGGRGGGGAGEGAAVEMELRVLCPADRVGIVIGKGGSRIKQIKEETGARVKVTEAVADCDERIVIIDAMEAPFSAHSPTEEALFRVHAAISQHHAGDRAAGAAEEGGRDSHGVTARLLVRKGQVGCVMGKGGSIISELRSTSRARINIPPRDQLPKCADESDEVLVVSGEPHCVSHALRLICARIRGRETAVASKGAAAADARGAAAGGGAGAAGAGGYAETGRGGGYAYPGSGSRGDAAYGYSPAGAAAPAVVATLSAGGPDGTVGWSYEPKVEPSYHDSGYSAPRGSGWDVAPAAAQEYGSYSHASAPAPAHFSSPPPAHTASGAASAGGTTGGGSAGAAGAAGGSGGAAGGGVMTALVTVPAVAAGAVIGKGGANIQQIKSVSGWEGGTMVGQGQREGVGRRGAPPLLRDTPRGARHIDAWKKEGLQACNRALSKTQPITPHPCQALSPLWSGHPCLDPLKPGPGSLRA